MFVHTSEPIPKLERREKKNGKVHRQLYSIFHRSCLLGVDYYQTESKKSKCHHVFTTCKSTLTWSLKLKSRKGPDYCTPCYERVLRLLVLLGVKVVTVVIC